MAPVHLESLRASAPTRAVQLAQIFPRLAGPAMAWAVPPATVEVVTFGADHPGGTAARHFYQQLSAARLHAG